LPVEDRKRTFKKFVNNDFYVFENKKLKECYLDIYFLDMNRKVLCAHRIYITPSPIIRFPIPFKTEYPFQAEYRYIALAYKFVFTSVTPQGSNVEKIYTHELDIEKN